MDLTLLKPVTPLMGPGQCAYDRWIGTGRSIIQDPSPVTPRETERNDHNRLFLFGCSFGLDLDPVPVDYDSAEVWKQLVPLAVGVALQRPQHDALDLFSANSRDSPCPFLVVLKQRLADVVGITPA